MNVIIEEKENGFVAISIKNERLAILKWSVEEKKPKHGEVWVCESHPFEALELKMKIEDIPKRMSDYYHNDKIKRIKTSFKHLNHENKNI